MNLHVSASQISRAKGCMRRWAWERVAPVPPKQEQEARLALGRAVHEVAEAYQKHGTRPDRGTLAGRVFLPALPLLPAPGTSVAELEIELADPPFLGYVDLLAGSGSMTGDWPGCTHVILDYKTKDTFTAKSMFQGLGDFLTDPQALVYAYWYFRTYPENPVVGLRWLYLRVKGRPKAQVCDAIMTRVQAREAFHRLIAPLADRLIELRKKPLEPLTLEPNPLECLRYGIRYACPYISRCGLTVSQRVQGAMNMSLIDDLRNQFGPKGVNPPEGMSQNGQTPGLPLGMTVNQPPSQLSQNKVTNDPVLAAVVIDAELGRALRLILRALRG